jgi:hypothetical protein
MDASSPGAVVARCGEIEDSMMQIEHLIVNAIRLDIKHGEFLKMQRMALADQVPADWQQNAERRKAWVELQIEKSDEYSEWVEAHADRKALETQADLLGKRLTACQSVLKRFEREIGGTGAGAGQQNR